MTPVRLEPAAPQSRVKHSTTEPLHSLICKWWCNRNTYILTDNPIFLYVGHLGWGFTSLSTVFSVEAGHIECHAQGHNTVTLISLNLKSRALPLSYWAPHDNPVLLTLKDIYNILVLILSYRSAPAVNCWVIIHCFEVSCKKDQISSASYLSSYNLPTNSELLLSN